MAGGEAMIVAGIGCRRGATAAAIEQSIEAALAECGLKRSQLIALATAAGKSDEPGLREAAARLCLPLIALAKQDLVRAAPGALTRSQLVLDLKGVPSVAETAALAAAGPNGRLLAPRVSNREASCAIAMGKSE
jgi:cobalt-precorrin 5A hydrolase